MDFPSVIEFSRLCRMLDAKVVTLLWFSMYVKEMFNFINVGG